MINLDPVTTVMAFLLFGAFSVPFIANHRKNKKKAASLLQSLHSKAQELGAQLDQTETWRYLYGLGLDSSRKHLAYTGPDFQSTLIDLKEVKKVQPIRRTREIDSNGQKRSVLDEIYLEVSFTTQGKKPLLLEIYNQEQFSDLQGETLIADRWADLVQKLLH